jgi:hypothetical protein
MRECKNHYQCDEHKKQTPGYQADRRSLAIPPDVGLIIHVYHHFCYKRLDHVKEVEENNDDEGYSEQPQYDPAHDRSLQLVSGVLQCLGNMPGRWRPIKT